MTPPGSVLEVLWVATRLGLSSFGGPVAHLGYFRREYVERRGWLDDATFGHLLALCQSLPGPASSQLGFAIGLRRAGIGGGIAAWLGFTWPSAVAMIAIGLLFTAQDLANAAWVHGLAIAAVAVVAQAVWILFRRFAFDAPRRAIAALALAAALLVPSTFATLAIVLLACLAGAIVLEEPTDPADAPPSGRLSARAGTVAFALFAGLLIGLPLLRGLGGHAVAVVDGFYRSGALVFGGGHVVLPLLAATTVDPGWVTSDQFVAGYGAAQAMPGPLFTFAGYLGSVSSLAPNGVAGGLLATVSIFLPGLLLVTAALPLWTRFGGWPPGRRALAGVNAAVVGILAAALYSPVWTSGIGGPADVVIAAAALGVLLTNRINTLLVVAGCAAAAQALAIVT